MADTVDAVAVETFTLANHDTSYFEGAVVRALPAGQFADLEAIGLVREATAEEIAADDAPEPAPSVEPLAS